MQPWTRGRPRPTSRNCAGRGRREKKETNETGTRALRDLGLDLVGGEDLGDDVVVRPLLGLAELHRGLVVAVAEREDLPVVGVGEEDADLRARGDVFLEREDVDEAELVHALRELRLAAEEAAELAEEARLGRQEVERVVAVAELGVDHEHEARARGGGDVLDGLLRLQARLHERARVEARLRGLGDHQSLAVDAAGVQPLLAHGRRRVAPRGPHGPQEVAD